MCVYGCYLDTPNKYTRLFLCHVETVPKFAHENWPIVIYVQYIYDDCNCSRLQFEITKLNL